MQNAKCKILYLEVHKEALGIIKSSETSSRQRLNESIGKVKINS